MKRSMKILFASLVLTVSAPALAESVAAVRVPMCLQYPDRKVYVPCTGVVPVDTITGDALDWDTIIKGTPNKPVYTQPIVNGQPVSLSNPLPTTGSSSGTADQSRRTFWSERNTPLVASATFTGLSRDNGGTFQGGASKWSNFFCFSTSDQSGTLYLQGSNDGTVWFSVQTKTMSGAVGSVYLSQPMFTKYWRCQIVNGAADQTMFILNSGFGF